MRYVKSVGFKLAVDFVAVLELDLCFFFLHARLIKPGSDSGVVGRISFGVHYLGGRGGYLPPATDNFPSF